MCLFVRLGFRVLVDSFLFIVMSVCWLFVSYVVLCCVFLVVFVFVFVISVLCLRCVCCLSGLLVFVFLCIGCSVFVCAMSDFGLSVVLCYLVGLYSLFAFFVVCICLFLFLCLACFVFVVCYFVFVVVVVSFVLFSCLCCFVALRFACFVLVFAIPVFCLVFRLCVCSGVCFFLFVSCF